ncbi:MAG: TfoX/Sxy family protein [Burkholderiales bacterium]
MAAAPNDFVAHCLELLASVGATRSRRMFGGHGIYVDELFVGLIAFDRLYLKADASTRASFEAAGCQPFVYDGAGKSVTLGYFTAPEEAMESPPLMQPWARLALAAALRARALKPPAKAPKPQAKARKGSARTAPKKP